MAGKASATVVGVRLGAQEAASSARRRRGNRRRWTEPYTPGYYYEYVYLSTRVTTSGSTYYPANWRYNSAALNRMKAFLGLVELTLALLVMLGVLLQTPKASGLGGTIGGGGDSGGGYRTKRGLEKNLFYATIGLVVLFVVVSVVYIRV
jgi:protein translocase SecG subunit